MDQNKKPQPPGPDKSRNEYIPSYISKRPFWAETTHSSDPDYLEHQRLQSAPKDTLDKAKWYDRGKKLGPAATKFRKGACENCGAMTHKTKECLSRPRKQGARWTGRDIAADEMVEDVQLGWDAKRDRWNGYDSREYSAVVKEYEELEALKQSATAGASTGTTGKTAATNTNTNGDPDSGARYAEETDMGRSQPNSTRQLRLREDTAIYLKNLDLDSARYDPKTRSMDKSAQLEQGDDVDVSDGFMRPAATADDAAEFERAQKAAWEAQQVGNSSSSDPSLIKKQHLQANPTEGEFLRKKQTTEAAEKKAATRKALLDKYGDDQHLSQSHNKAKKLKTGVIATNERYVEYDEHGQIKGTTSSDRTAARSKYAEDVLTNNHTFVWGSWWHDFTWGYACCHSTVRNSYCTGDEGRRAWEESEGMRTGEALLQIENGGDAENNDEKGILRPPQQQQQQQQQSEEDPDDHDDHDHDHDHGHDRHRDHRESAEKITKPQTQVKAKKRTLEELQSGISEEELESYKRNRLAADDPMANMLGTDELIEMK